MRRLPDPRRWLPCALFAVALLAPLPLRFARPDAAAGSVAREMRRPAPFPPAPRTLELMLEWPGNFEAWHADSLGGRDQLLRWNHALALFVFRHAPDDTLFLGRNGWIFLTGDESRPAWRGLLPLEQGVADGWVRELRAREAWFRAQHMTYLRVCAPNKETIYPEQLPDTETRCGPTPYEQLLERFARETQPLPFLDLRAALLEEKRFDVPAEDDFVFHRQGSHWTARGAFAAARAIVARLQAQFPALRVPQRADYERRELLGDPGDTWAKALSLEDVLAQRVWDFAPREPQARCVGSGGGLRYLDTSASWENAAHPELPTMLLVSDSFGPWLHPLLAEDARRLVFAWKSSIPQQELVAAHPQVVLELYVERHVLEVPRPLSAGLRILGEAEFRGLAPLAQGEQLLHDVQPWMGTPCELGSDGLRVRAAAPRDKLLLPPFDPGPGRRLALHLSLVAPLESVGLLWCQSESQPEYQQRERLAFDVAAGANEIYFELPVDGLRGRILLLPGIASGEYLLRGIEARTLPR